MPSNKPRLVTYTTDLILKKFDYIANYENRSNSKELEFIVKEYINDFEKKHGIIILENITQDKKEEKSGKNNTAINIGIVNKNKQTFN